MQIDVIGTIGEARSDAFIQRTVIVIDVLRATSTMITALDEGIRGIIPVETVLQAKELQKPGDILGGERMCRKIPGFDYGNSPLEYKNEAIRGKRLIMTTTNGTRGFHKAERAEFVLAGALLNGKSCALAAAEIKRDIVIICAGTQDVFALEDGLCAGQIVDALVLLLGEANASLNDLATAMRSTFLQLQANIPDVLLRCSNGKRLSKLGFRGDVEYCAQLNMTETVPLWRYGMMTSYRK
ncbi:2-phosphosulfolactate phosphatase [Paenibacillus eucommiae]|uniref:Probable 2-phosphosulfolactate phosphatase n=1 Tax=Paenibacillus eucommiae TaxID=1355755 RepID=A0ABS4INC2_9BACL|nr:2-phosphosulfolactate phosphatase [Paenibacillus eucommiae]MBP1989055.1 2-phosphosulfolactate phosphatase [Paenibacillus eucommiae]